MATNPSSSDTTISLKLLVDKSSNKVVFAETGKEFVDFLFGLLQVPLGSIIGLLRDNDLAAGSGSLGRVHESIQNLDPSYLLPNQTKGSLLNPKPAFQSSTLTPPLLQNFVSPDQEIRAESQYFSDDCDYPPRRRTHAVENNSEKGYVRGGSGSLGRVHESIQNLDPSYLLPNQTKGSLVNPKPAFQSLTLTPPLLQNFVSPDQEIRAESQYFSDDCDYPPRRRTHAVENNSEKGYVRGVVTYMVMDDLTVKPMSTISSITLLNTLNIKDMGSVQEKKVEIDIKKGLELIKVSLYSTAVLTDVFLGKRE